MAEENQCLIGFPAEQEAELTQEDTVVPALRQRAGLCCDTWPVNSLYVVGETFWPGGEHETLALTIKPVDIRQCVCVCLRVDSD